jgi:RNase P/RNase MRP subunit p29
MTKPVGALFAVLVSAAVVAGSTGAAFAQASSTAAAQQSQKVHGSVVSVQGNTMTFKADDGRTLTVDISKVNPAVQKALMPNEKATLMGTPGSQPNQFTAQFIQQDSSNPSRGGTVVGQTPAPAAQQWQDVHGSIVSVQGSTMTFKADDGRTLTVDATALSPQVRQALKANEGATLVGFAGSQPNQFTAQFVQQDSSDPSRGGTVAGQPSTATDKTWQRVHGTVGTVSGNTLSLKTDDGQTVNVDVAQVDAGIRGNVKTGDPVTVIGFYRLDAQKNVDKKQLDARFIQKDSGAAASPRTTK